MPMHVLVLGDPLERRVIVPAPWNRMDHDRRDAIRRRADTVLDALAAGEL